MTPPDDAQRPALRTAWRPAGQSQAAQQEPPLLRWSRGPPGPLKPCSSLRSSAQKPTHSPASCMRAPCPRSRSGLCSVSAQPDYSTPPARARCPPCRFLAKTSQTAGSPPPRCPTNSRRKCTAGRRGSCTLRKATSSRPAPLRTGRDSPCRGEYRPRRAAAARRPRFSPAAFGRPRTHRSCPSPPRRSCLSRRKGCRRAAAGRQSLPPPASWPRSRPGPAPCSRG
mmetsp:Transcript_16920/g.41954  ORF Transcript_16920/g.41954 Transcript_16920/m.41954 type:complete len:225 (+) Transcript_16920:996-1670(+)